MKFARYVWNTLCCIFALLAGMSITPKALNNLADVDRYSGDFQNAIIMGSLEGFALLLLIWVGCFCLSSPRWGRIATIDRFILCAIGLIFVIGAIASAIISHRYIARIHWNDLLPFIGVFIVLAGPAIFAGYGHTSLLKNVIEKVGDKRTHKKYAKDI